MIKPDVLIDSNILVYAINVSDSIKHRLSMDLITLAINHEIHLAVSVQNLAEMTTVINHLLEISHPSLFQMKNNNRPHLCQLNLQS